MAITQEQIDALKPEGFEDAKWKALSDGFIKLHNDDTTGLQNNELKMKKEKQDLKDKYDAYVETAKASETKYQTDLAALNEQLKKNSPESIKAIYEGKQKELETLLESTKNDLGGKLTESAKKIAELEQGVFQKDCLESFTSAVANKNLDPQALEDAKLLILGENCNKFKRVDIGDGKSLVTNEAGENIAKAVDTFLSTSVGKRFVLNKSTGGSADGGKGSTTTDQTTMKVADWQALPIREQAAAAMKYKIVD